MRKVLLPLVGVMALLTGCGESEKSQRGLELLPDMFHSPAYESQTSRTSADGAVQTPMLMPPVEGTVPRGFTPYSVKPLDWAAARSLVNPQAPTAETLRAGQQGYLTTCAVCHGRDGNAAHGNVAKQFSGIPSVNGANITAMTDGEIYHIITVGRGRMQQHRAQLPPERRWAVVHYVRTLSRATIAMKEIESVVGDAETVLRANPTDPAAQAAMATNRSILEQRKADLEAILHLPHPDAARRAFAPLPEPVPDYVPPSWGTPAEAGAAAGGHH